jgi:hypothetical protein
MNKSKILIYSFIFGGIILIFNYQNIVTSIAPHKYWDYDIADNDIVIYNPFYPTYDDFRFFAQRLRKHENSTNKDSILFYSHKIIDYRNSFNDRQQEKLYSCGNGYWKDKSEKLLYYSKSYEHMGKLDSAISVMRPSLKMHEGFYAGIQDRFFTLKLKKYPRELILKEINKNIENSYESNCPNCMERTFLFQGAEIGFYLDEHSTVEEYKQTLWNQIISISEQNNG